ncbi:MAG: hypothetical protein RLZ44_948 [Pseudomonadota bacterium]
MNLTRSIILLLLSLAALTPTQAATSVSTPHATVTLLSESAQPTPGATLWLGLHFELIPHWHLYWRNPGASGAAPKIRWQLPEGWVVGDIHWPVPRRIRVGPLTNYGYEDAVTLLVPVEVPPGPLPAAPRVTAEADWLVCREECIPESGQFTLDFAAPGPGSPANAALFAAARDRWPAVQALTGRYRVDGATLTLRVDAPQPATAPAELWFAAHDWGPVDPSGAQRWQRDDGGWLLEVPAGDLPPTDATPLAGLLVLESAGEATPTRRGYRVQLAAGPTPPPAPEGAPPSLATALALALLGGLILNVMPCVLPVLGIKVLGFVREAGADRRRLAGHGLVYAAGVLASFALLASALLALRAGGESLGWGFQLQSPPLVALLAYLMLLVGLNLSGVFTVGGGLMGAGQALTGGSRLHHTFATGVLAAVVASPCTAPFMGAALGYAITRPAAEALAVFLALGAGFALPVLLLSLLPAWVRFIPRPGPWMKRFQQLLAFPMFATAAWLLWVLSQQTDARGYGLALAGLVLVTMAAWAYGQWQPRGWRLGLMGAGSAVLLAAVLGPLATSEPTLPAGGTPAAQPWSEQRVRELTAAGRPVFVNFTAAWCITCKVNEQVALATADTRRLFADRAVAYLVADWTRRDPAITRQLERYGRSGVPLYLLYAPEAAQPVVLPQLLTEGIVAQAIQAL